MNIFEIAENLPYKKLAKLQRLMKIKNMPYDLSEADFTGTYSVEAYFEYFKFAFKHNAPLAIKVIAKHMLGRSGFNTVRCEIIGIVESVWPEGALELVKKFHNIKLYKEMLGDDAYNKYVEVLYPIYGIADCEISPKNKEFLDRQNNRYNKATFRSFSWHGAEFVSSTLLGNSFNEIIRNLLMDENITYKFVFENKLVNIGGNCDLFAHPPTSIKLIGDILLLAKQAGKDYVLTIKLASGRVVSYDTNCD